jgi:hypothetical protein
LFGPEIVAEGDSVMASTDTPLAFLKQRLEKETGRSWRSRNLAKPGERVGIEILASEKSELPFYRLPWKKSDKLWLFAGTNDFTANGGPAAVEKLLSDVEMYFRNAHAVGYEEDNCFYTDILPRNVRRENPTFDADRQSFNSQIASRLKASLM